VKRTARNETKSTKTKRSETKSTKSKRNRKWKKNNRGLKEIKLIFTIMMLDYFPHMSVFHPERTGFDILEIFIDFFDISREDFYTTVLCYGKDLYIVRRI
jgi:succinate dehydrogenase flavin-adding protein (antitoxin of CptAB toxin-antitoxin module)